MIAARSLELIETKTAAINEIVRLELLIGCRTDEDAVLVNDKLGGFLMHSIGHATWNALGLARLGSTFSRSAALPLPP